MGRASRAKRDRRLVKATEADRIDRLRAEERARIERHQEAQAQHLAAAEERRVAKALAAKAERAERRQAKLVATAARQAAALAARGPWGGAREGSGRPRVHATNAERQAAYRARRRGDVSDES
jgi:hypothetical protein